MPYIGSYPPTPPPTPEIILILLTHCILNRLSHTMYWKNPISILGTSRYEIYIFLEKMAKLFANGGDPDQTPRSAASDLGLHCLPITLLRVSRLHWVKLLTFEPEHSLFYKIACAPSEDSDQPAYLRSITRLFAVCLKTHLFLGYPQGALRRLCSNCTDAQADLSLRWAHIQSCRGCCVPAQLLIIAEPRQ